MGIRAGDAERAGATEGAATAAARDAATGARARAAARAEARPDATLAPHRSADFIRVTFEDEGCGIPESVMHKVGTPRFTTKKGGTGLGLAVVNKIVSQHSGSLEILSREAKGTTVNVFLPGKRTATG